MPFIEYKATNFSGPFAEINGNVKIIEVTWAQLVWAAITVGKAAGDEYAYGIYSALERLHRASMVRAYLFESSSGNLFQTNPYEMSDPSEKTSISFYLGMTLAKLFAELLFNVPRMLHVAVYGQNYQIATGQGASRPDLIGITANGQWFVFEAKGRSNGFDSSALASAKTQAQQISSIDGAPPVCSIASQSFFSSKGLRFQMDDPEPNETNHPRKLSINREEFENAYYAPIRSILASRRSAGTPLATDGPSIPETRIEEMDISIALMERDAPSDNTSGSEKAQLSSFVYSGGDGVLVRLGSSWSPANMRLQPHLRS